MGGGIKQKILNLIFPIECVGCGREDVWLCKDCLAKIPLNSLNGCFFCGRKNPTGSTCPSCAGNGALDGVFICTDYENKIVKELIKKLKYSFASGLGKTLAYIMVRFFKENKTVFTLDNFTVMPIPLHKKRLNWRGFNQAALIAENFARASGLEFSTDLIRVQHKTPQAKLGGAERKENIKDCFISSGGNLEGKNILLIDDVATTGSTLNEAAKILKAADVKKVWGLVIAKG